jgi:hypothetical protein
MFHILLFAGLLPRIPEGPTTGHFDTGLPWFYSVFKHILTLFSKFQFVTAYFSQFDFVRIKNYFKNGVFWDVALCTSWVNRRFGGTYRFHLKGRKILRNVG